MGGKCLGFLVGRPVVQVMSPVESCGGRCSRAGTGSLSGEVAVGDGDFNQRWSRGALLWGVLVAATVRLDAETAYASG